MVRDSMGRTASTGYSITNIDNTLPEAVSVNYSPSSNTNQSVEVTLIINKEVQSIPGWTGTGTTWTRIYASNTTETVTFYDLVGNSGSTGIEITWIDKTPVTCTVTYDPSGKTNQDVTATLTGCNKDITVTNNSGNMTYIFTGNGEFTFEYEDDYGNTGSSKAEISTIDKDPITCTLVYDPEGKTNTDVTVTLTGCNKDITVTNNSGDTTYIFTGNGEFTFEYEDDYGNTGSKTINISTIDKAPVTCSVTYSPATNTNQDVVATLTGCNKDIEVTNNSGINYTFIEDGEFTFEFIDAAGNT